MIKHTIRALLGCIFPRTIFSKRSYSQEGEDLIVDRLLGGKKKGFYVEVGAHHPFRFSNTYYFYRKGWSGICIDPLPGIRKSFNRWRPRDLFLEIGISAKPGILKYYMFNEPALNTFDSNIAAERNFLRDYRLIESRNINTFTLEEILKNNIPSQQEIDMLSVDVEGLDLEVLKSNNWELFSPRVIIAECLSTLLDEVSSDHVYIFLKSMGYKLYGKSGFSFIFILDNP